MSLHRLIDANANRAREGLRVIEDVARFVVDNAALCADCKAVRHDVTAAVTELGPGGPLELLASRDTPSDVGTTVSTPGEGTRQNTASIVHAAAGRTTEALRALEEAAKVLDQPLAARTLEQARYRVYDLHKRLALLLGPGGRTQFRLCVLLTTELCTHHPIAHVAELALAGGADCLQLREKSLPDRDLLTLATRLASLTREHGASLFINDRTDIALLSGAHGVHLGQTDLPPIAARRLCGSRLLIGVSTGNISEALAAVRDGADVCGVGPMFPTTTKHKPVLAGPAYLREYLADARTARVPHLAIGGISAANIGELAAAGCQGVAVSGAVCGARDPQSICEQLVRALPAAQECPA
ncbi:MAG TPA: thiamine phosphate synthase [Phycisphaerales bacterium]|nr:thiamine phosphate synthase [Phycisphaerales bacterium]